jgi:hypothetical protein
MSAPIYIAKEGKQIGPFPAEAIVGMIDRGELSVDDYFWREGMADWQPLSEWQTKADAPAEVFSRSGDPLPTLPPALGEHPGFMRRAAAHILDGIIVYTLTLFIGFLMCIFTRRKQCLHDLIAGCVMRAKL